MGFPSKISTRDLARLLGISGQRVNQLAAENVFSKIGRDQYEAAASVKSYVKFREHAVVTEAGRYAGLSKERAGLVKAQRIRAEVELDALLGNTVLVSDAQAIIARHLVIIKNKLLGLGSKLGPMANPGAPILAQEVIYNGVVEALEQLSQLETYGPRAGNGEDFDGATAGAE